ncbi:hypothetical protein FACS1894172_19790 [Spirochaetia bacterium]|nr:hypothetical protein FACS1894164_18920 [Spirochaetia bacterium]GHU36735.1 hypothetical protein FACS1894172_19790 [Spirochaetia bacterium]
MKRSFYFFMLFVSVGACIALDLAEGFWLSLDRKTGEIDGGWEFYISGEKLFGKMLSSPTVRPDAIAIKCRKSYRDFPIDGAVNTMNIAGTPWIFGLVNEKPGIWTNGHVIDPRNGSIYQCKITFHAADGKKFPEDMLEMRGEILPGIGGSQFFRKSTRAEVSGLFKG